MTDLTDADRKLAFEFLELYASFEWALKTSGYLKSTKPGARAKPDWDKYAESLRGGLLSRREVDDARKLLVSRPPKEQRITREGRLGWDDVQHGQEEGEERRLLRLVQTVRNNLFHGGKYAAPIGPVGEPARDRPLLEASVRVLRVCIEVSPELKNRLAERS